MSKVVLCDVCGENRPGFGDPEGWMKLIMTVQEFSDAKPYLQEFDICSPVCLGNVATQMLEEADEDVQQDADEEFLPEVVPPRPERRKQRLEPLTTQETPNGRRPLTEDEIEAMTGVTSRTGKKRGI